MRAILNSTILLVTTLSLFPAAALAHPGHEGHGGPVALPLSQFLLALMLGSLPFAAGAAWRWWRGSSN